jgi:ATPase subunit of ABC transporter with duplicated ATPase domains
MAQYIYTTNRLAKVVPPKRHIIRDISLSFFPGAKIGVLGLNGAGKSTLLRIMAGIDKEFDGEARPQPGINMSRQQLCDAIECVALADAVEIDRDAFLGK